MKYRFKSRNLIDYLRHATLEPNLWNANRSMYLQHCFNSSKTLYYQDGNHHSGCVNALDFSSNGLLLASGFIIDTIRFI